MTPCPAGASCGPYVIVWTYDGQGEEGFNLYYRFDGLEYSQVFVGVIGRSQRSYQVPANFVGGARPCFILAAFNSGGERPSNMVCLR